VINYVIIASPAEMLLKLLLVGLFFFSLAVISVIITYLVAFSATNRRTYHKVAIGHLMQAWARFDFSAFHFLMKFR